MFSKYTAITKVVTPQSTLELYRLKSLPGPDWTSGTYNKRRPFENSLSVQNKAQ